MDFIVHNVTINKLNTLNFHQAPLKEPVHQAKLVRQWVKLSSELKSVVKMKSVLFIYAQGFEKIITKMVQGSKIWI